MYSNKIINIINNEKIHLLHEELDPNVLGSYFAAKDINVIIINKSIVNNYRVTNTVIAEELGHHFTSTGDKGPYINNLYLNDLNYYKSEDAALRWAVNFMIPTDELLSFISTNQTTNIYDLSQEFGVTQGFIRFKFKYMSLEKSVYTINSEKNLVLSELPSLILKERSN